MQLPARTGRYTNEPPQRSLRRGLHGWLQQHDPESAFDYTVCQPTPPPTVQDAMLCRCVLHVREALNQRRSNLKR